MANLDDLNHPSITEISRLEALSIIERIRERRRTPTKQTRTRTTTPKKLKTPEVTAQQAASLLRILTGGS